METTTKKWSLGDQLKSKTTISLEEYIGLLGEDGKFVIPDYQRGYVWGKMPKGRKDEKGFKEDAVTHLVNSLIGAYSEYKDKSNKSITVFLQGITVHEDSNHNIVLVDGQQRTTFFYLLLRYLNYQGQLQIQYTIRKESNKFLEDLDIDNTVEKEDAYYQDIFFFQRTIGIFKSNLKDIDKEDFLGFILSHVKFLVVCIPEEQAKIVFTMMNGNKAQMKAEELIKSELLRCASLKHDEIISEAEHAMVRSRLAREWDAWLHWWNQKEIIDFFHTDGKIMGWLLPLISKKSEVSFEEFRDKLLKEDQSVKQAKEVFKKMRLLQKSIEDAYNTSQQYNYIGAILYIRRDKERIFSFLRWFFKIDSELSQPKSLKELERYYQWTILNVNHEDIVNNHIDKYEEQRVETRSQLESNLLYKDSYDTAFRWLLHQNIMEDNRFSGRKFDFRIDKEKSLEHIYPKSKIGHKNENDIPLDYDGNPLDKTHLETIKLWREQIRWVDAFGISHDGSEHCIGNLVLLYKRDNSKFGDADYNTKNERFFSDMDDEGFKSRHLIHTTMIFSQGAWRENGCWNPEQIAHRKYDELDKFDKYYHPEIAENSHE
jgi:hypothetical protein